MPRRPVPSSLWWLGWLFGLSLVVAVVTGAAMFIETRHANRVRADMITAGDWRRGEAAITRYGCGACHLIPGIDGALGKVGPDLTHVGQRAALAGSLPNDPGMMALWLMHPQHLRPGSGMPEQGIGEQEARDIAAYLYAEK